MAKDITTKPEMKDLHEWCAASNRIINTDALNIIFYFAMIEYNHSIKISHIASLSSEDIVIPHKTCQHINVTIKEKECECTCQCGLQFLFESSMHESPNYDRVCSMICAFQKRHILFNRMIKLKQMKPLSKDQALANTLRWLHGNQYIRERTYPITHNTSEEEVQEVKSIQVENESNGTDTQQEQNTHRKCIPKPKRIKVWTNAFGNVFETKCPMCNRALINALNFEIGHDVAVSKGGSDDIQNLAPICSSCNKSMGTKRWMDFKKDICTFTPSCFY